MSFCQCQAPRSWEEVDIDGSSAGLARQIHVFLRSGYVRSTSRLVSAPQASGGRAVDITESLARGKQGNEYWCHAMPNLPRNPPIRRVRLSSDSRRTHHTFLLIVAPFRLNCSHFTNRLNPCFESKADRDRTNTRCLANLAFLHRY